MPFGLQPTHFLIAGFLIVVIIIVVALVSGAKSAARRTRSTSSALPTPKPMPPNHTLSPKAPEVSKPVELIPVVKKPDEIRPVTTERSQRRLKVFLCHSSADKPAVRDLYNRLRSEQIDPWLDEENLLPGEDWQIEIPNAVRQSDAVLVCLSRGSVTKSGYVQKEIRYALDVADEQPEGTIFVIPLKLEECDVPVRLSHWQWVNYFDERGFERLLLALRKRMETIGPA